MDPCSVPPEAQTFLYGARKLLLVLHAASAIVLIGSATHHVLRMPAFLVGKGIVRFDRIYSRIVATAYVTTYTLGAVLYPTYRYHVRALYLDRFHPMVSNLFDIKENMATITLLLALALGVMGGRLTNEPEDRPFVRIHASMSLFIATVVWFNVITGMLIVSYRSV